jgi:hypothetical protein
MPRHRFGRTPRFKTPKPAVKQVQVEQKRRTRCRGCGGFIEKGEQVYRLVLNKKHRGPCSSCGTVPKKAKRYHLTCLPADINKAMGHNPTAAPPPPPPFGHSSPFGPPPSAKVAPPPKPPSARDSALAALLAMETAVVRRMAEDGITPEAKKAYELYNKLKKLALDKGAFDNEAKQALRNAMTTIVKIVF